MQFLDQVHVEHLRKKLWCNRDYGQASVMIGAGLSRCAEPQTSGVPSFPLWRQLAEAIYSNLYPDTDVKDSDRASYERKKNESLSGSGALRLASEFEISFGRSALDDLITQSIPDDRYFPGIIHQLLLSLPWSDIFTTNYDTLLERTRPYIYDRRYDLILTSSDIPGRMKPRIVKLHGSLPSHRPFILTEEDFRAYPRLYSPFVNLVQESIMENTLCLLGFSGEDPNFLHWSGWVRDNLGSATPPIYLCGLLNLSVSQRKLLESRNVILIDLSPLFPENLWPDIGVRHAKSTEWLLLNLLYGKTPSKAKWPDSTIVNKWHPSKVLPPIPSGPTRRPKLAASHPGFQSDNLELVNSKLINTANAWADSRIEYPGWIIAPNDIREKIWSATESWIEPIIVHGSTLHTPDDLYALYELNWRLEITMMPLLDSWMAVINKVTDRYNPFPEHIQDDSKLVPDHPEHTHVNWKKVRECWVALRFALIRSARDNQDEELFNKRLSYLEPIIDQDNEWYARWHYEKCLFHLYRSDTYRVRMFLKAWKETPSKPIWDAKRSSILAEIGDLNEAERLAKQSLAQVRSQLQPGNIDYLVLSQEGMIMLLLRRLASTVGEYNEDRWEYLTRNKCNPQEELDMLSPTLSKQVPDFNDPNKRKDEFDPGRITTTISMAIGRPEYKARDAFALLRIFEEGGIPVRCGNNCSNSQELDDAAKWIRPFFPIWSLGVIMRSFNQLALGEWYDRHHVATLTPDEVASLYDRHFSQVNWLLRQVQSEHLGGGTSHTFMPVDLPIELISRLCLRLDIGKLELLLDVAIIAFNNSSNIRNYQFAKSLEHLFRRILYSAPQTLIMNRMQDLLSLHISDIEDFPEPFLNLIFSSNSRLDDDFDRSGWSGPINYLIETVKSGSVISRKKALIRLDKLYQLGALNETEVGIFAQALWLRIDPRTQLPADTGFHKFAYLMLPEETSGHAAIIIRDYLINSDIPTMASAIPQNDNTIAYTFTIAIPSIPDYVRDWIIVTKSAINYSLDDSRLIDWSSQEASLLLNKIAESWKRQKSGLEFQSWTGFDGFTADFRESISALLQLLSIVVIPRIFEEKDKLLALQTLTDMENSGLYIQQALLATLFIHPDKYDEVAAKLRHGLYGGSAEEIEKSLRGFVDWLSYASASKLKAPPTDILDQVVTRLAARAQPALDGVISTATRIVNILPSVLSERQVNLICLSLEHLFEETKILDNGGNDGYEIIIASDRSDYRRRSSELAKSVWHHYRSGTNPMPKVIDRWLASGLVDPLPEIRKLWQDTINE